MTFRRRVDLDPGRVQDVRGRRIRGGGLAVGGGLGTLILIAAVLLFGGDLGDLAGIGGGLTEGPVGSQEISECQTGADANQRQDCRLLGTIQSLDAYWSEEFSGQGTFQQPGVRVFNDGIDTQCGSATSAVGPFYCPPDQGIYLDTTFFADVLEGQLGGQGGDFVEPYVIGHEYGHHIQNLMGTMGKVRTQQGPESDAVRLELQADCYAGMWTKDASDGDGLLVGLDEGDIEEALDSAKAVGDDRIQQKSGQGVDPEGWTHGSSEQRMAWFTRGYEEGTLEACDTFSASQL